jgi:hypothetical protein
MAKATILAVAVLLITACDRQATAPHLAAFGEGDGASVATHMEIDRLAVAAGDEFVVTYTVKNSGLLPLQLHSTCAPVARVVILRDGVESPLMGSGSGCRNEIGVHDLPAGGTLEHVWHIRAAVVVTAYPDGSDPETVPAQAGHYRVRVQPDVITINGAAAQLPGLEKLITVH